VVLGPPGRAQALTLSVFARRVNLAREP
jgi:hypothetical protein